MVATLGFFAFKVLKSYWLYRVKVKATIADTLGAAVAGLGLSFTVARAFIEGIFTSNAPFLRTPKMEDKPALARALMAAIERRAPELGQFLERPSGADDGLQTDTPKNSILPTGDNT
jgi:hypothetical protein